MRDAPASSAFSTSSLTTEAGRSTTSPAAIRSITSPERRWILGMMPPVYRSAAPSRVADRPRRRPGRRRPSSSTAIFSIFSGATVERIGREHDEVAELPELERALLLLLEGGVGGGHGVGPQRLLGRDLLLGNPAARVACRRSWRASRRRRFRGSARAARRPSPTRRPRCAFASSSDRKAYAPRRRSGPSRRSAQRPSSTAWYGCIEAMTPCAANRGMSAGAQVLRVLDAEAAVLRAVFLRDALVEVEELRVGAVADRVDLDLEPRAVGAGDRAPRCARAGSPPRRRRRCCPDRRRTARTSARSRRRASRP